MEIITNRYRRETGKSAYKYNWFGKRIHNQDYVDWLEKQCTIHGVSNTFFCGDTIKHNYSMNRIDRCIPCERIAEKLAK